MSYHFSHVDVVTTFPFGITWSKKHTKVQIVDEWTKTCAIYIYIEDILLPHFMQVNGQM